MGRNPLLVALGGLLAMAAGIGVGRFVYTPILPAMVAGVPLTNSEAGLIASANFVGYLAGALLAALPLPGTRHAWLLAALGLNAACLAAMGLSSALPMLLLWRLLAGVASALVLIFSSALVLDWLARHGRSALSAVHFAGVGSGIVVSAALVATLSDWRTMWLASGALALVAALLVALTMPAVATAHGTGPMAPTRVSARFAALAAAYGLFGFGYIITATFIVAMVRGTPAIAALEPYIWIVVGLAAAPSVVLWRGLGTRLGILKAFAVASLVEAVGVAASVLFQSTAGILLSAVFLGGTFMGLTALGVTAAREGVGDPRSRIALMTAAFSAGQIVGPSFAGYLYDHTGSLTAPSLAAAGALVVGALLAAIADAHRR